MDLKTIRLSCNLTQSELAKKLNVSRTTITMWEQKKAEPNIEKLKKLAEIFNCKVDDLLKEE